jgi:2-polyprenyl-3-methyl-5-hydroxy-6-metoxy-1,4-benzoquinol methylase
MSRAPEVAPAGGAPINVPTGNTFDKYGSTNPVVRRLMSGFEGALARLFMRAAPDSVLDVGCGEGVLTYKWAQALGDGPVLGIDLADPKLETEWSTRARPNLEFRAMTAEELQDLPFPDRSFDLAAAIEVLEHVPDPERTFAEMARVTARHLLVSVPREPLWRALNVARGAYVRDLGNTPGHVNHWSKRSFVRMAARHGEVVEACSPFPWTMLLVRVR